MITYLDRFIARMSAQRACLRWALRDIAALPGPILEFGLGSGRSYDFLRRHAAEREIHVFDRSIEAHPACIPPGDRMVLGDFTATAPRALSRFAGKTALIHADIGSSDLAASRALAETLAPIWARLLRADGLLVSDQRLTGGDLVEVAVPREDLDHYHVYRRQPESEVHFVAAQQLFGGDEPPR